MPEKTIINQQQRTYLMNRINAVYNLRWKAKPYRDEEKEPAEVRRVRKLYTRVVQGWEARKRKAKEKISDQFSREVALAKEKLLFASGDEALTAVKKLEAFAAKYVRLE